MAWLAIGSSVLKGVLGSRSAKKDAKRDAQEAEKDRQFQRETQLRQRREQLERQRYKEDAVGGYGQFYQGPAVQSPARTDVAAEMMRNENLVMSPWDKPKKVK